MLLHFHRLSARRTVKSEGWCFLQQLWSLLHHLDSDWILIVKSQPRPLQWLPGHRHQWENSMCHWRMCIGRWERSSLDRSIADWLNTQSVVMTDWRVKLETCGRWMAVPQSKKFISWTNTLLEGALMFQSSNVVSHLHRTLIIMDIFSERCNQR